jgi:hypothetical protein
MYRMKPFSQGFRGYPVNPVHPVSFLFFEMGS